MDLVYYKRSYKFSRWSPCDESTAPKGITKSTNYGYDTGTMTCLLLYIANHQTVLVN